MHSAAVMVEEVAVGLGLLAPHSVLRVIPEPQRAVAGAARSKEWRATVGSRTDGMDCIHRQMEEC